MKITVPFTLEQVKQIAQTYPTPFHIYDEQAIRENARRLTAAFSWAPEFQEYFAVKAAPNPYLLKILKEEGFGGDCSSMAELVLCEKVGITGEKVMFTSNETPIEEYIKAKEMGAVLNLDDITHIVSLSTAKSGCLKLSASGTILVRCGVVMKLSVRRRKRNMV